MTTFLGVINSTTSRSFQAPIAAMLIRAHARGIVQLSLRPVPVIARPISSVVPFRHVRHATSKTAAAPPQKQTEQHGRLPSQQQQEQKNKEGFTSLSSSQKSWLTQKIETSPAAKKMFFGITNLLGYGSPKQVAGQRSFAMYEQICAVRPDQERLFWQKGMPCLPSLSNIIVFEYGHEPLFPPSLFHLVRIHVTQ